MSYGTKRPMLARFQFIAARLRTDRFITAGDLASQMEVSSKTIQRDLQFMRDRMELPIESSTCPGGGYRFTDPVAICPVCQRQNGKRDAGSARRRRAKIFNSHRGC